MRELLWTVDGEDVDAVLAACQSQSLEEAQRGLGDPCIVCGAALPQRGAVATITAHLEACLDTLDRGEPAPPPPVTAMDYTHPAAARMAAVLALHRLLPDQVATALCVARDGEPREPPAREVDVAAAIASDSAGGRGVPASSSLLAVAADTRCSLALAWAMALRAELEAVTPAVDLVIALCVGLGTPAGAAGGAGGAPGALVAGGVARAAPRIARGGGSIASGGGGGAAAARARMDRRVADAVVARLFRPAPLPEGTVAATGDVRRIATAAGGAAGGAGGSGGGGVAARTGRGGAITSWALSPDSGAMLRELARACTCGGIGAAALLGSGASDGESSHTAACAGVSLQSRPATASPPTAAPLPSLPSADYAYATAMAPVTVAAARVSAPAESAAEWGRRQRSDRSAGGVAAAYRGMADAAIASREAARREASLILAAFHNPSLFRLSAASDSASLQLALPASAAGDQITVNLHGQHADAAVALLRDRLLPWLGSAAAAALPASVVIVTGVGHGSAPMKAAVLAQLPRDAVVAGGRYVVSGTTATRRGVAGVVLRRL